jgi:hypothetical protein
LFAFYYASAYISQPSPRCVSSEAETRTRKYHTEGKAQAQRSLTLGLHPNFLANVIASKDGQAVPNEAVALGGPVIGPSLSPQGGFLRVINLPPVGDGAKHQKLP